LTKSVLHVTHTPASLPSCINTVSDIFGEYAIAGSVKAASGAGFEDALISPEGNKDSLVADFTPIEMGSDHDVYQEGSFRIPAIYLRDWPDVFIHTNNDSLSEHRRLPKSSARLYRGRVGVFLARSGAREAARLADEVFVRALARVRRSETEPRRRDERRAH
jgi:hypothetical protein